MKSIILLVVLLGCACILRAQKYPEPEFANEVYYLKKDSVNSVVRLEKESSKLDTKTKMTGYEQGYVIDGEKSRMRLRSGSSLSFVFSNGASAGAGNGMNTTQRDSILRANGMDPAQLSQAGMGGSMGMSSMSDPASNIELFKADTDKGKRKVITMKMGGGPFGAKKPTSSDKYTFSVKKIREGYWELVIDKTLPRGEYIFSLKNSASMDGSSTMYAFGVD